MSANKILQARQIKQLQWIINCSSLSQTRFQTEKSKCSFFINNPERVIRAFIITPLSCWNLFDAYCHSSSLVSFLFIISIFSTLVLSLVTLCVLCRVCLVSVSPCSQTQSRSIDALCCEAWKQRKVDTSLIIQFCRDEAFVLNLTDSLHVRSLCDAP